MSEISEFTLLDQSRCIAEARSKQGEFSSHHTYRCQRPEGHDGAHEYRHDVRTVTWYGEPRKQEDDTRFRYGFGR